MRKPLCHLSGSLVREGKEEDAPGVNAIVEQALDAGHQCARLPDLNDPYELLCMDLSDKNFRRSMNAWK